LKPRRLTLDDVRRAQGVIGRHLAPTPLRPSHAAPGTFLKLECWQPTGSFKVRGAVSILASLDAEERSRGVVAASAGNHALGVAHACALLGGGLQATLFVPTSAPRAKVDKLRAFPVTVREVGATYDDAVAAALEEVERTGATYLHAFDDPRTAAGQGTIAFEILEQVRQPPTVVVPVGGGGLISATAVALKARSPRSRVIAVQPEASPALRESLAQGRPLLEYPAEPTLADGLSGGIGETVWAHLDLIDDIVVVPEREIEEAIVALVEKDQVVAEGSGAIAVAAVRSGRVDPGPGPIVAVITGGNLDASVLRRLLAAS
jgi:threonine dehydratase